MDNSPLAKVPPELRNQIYELAVTQDEPIRVDWCPLVDCCGGDFL